AVYLQAVAALPLPRRLDPTLIRLGGWRELAAAVAARARTERASFVVSDSYGDAALLARLLPADIPVVGADQRWAVFALPDAAPLIAGRDGLLLRSGRRSDPPDASDWAQMQPVGEVSRARGAIVAETYRLYRVVGGRPTPPLPVVVLPRPRSDACLLC
ncbi:MAG: hypothetical protein JOY70_10740, partial [Acidisphaera sp.]|nr:hypothetical protein [Acidisphaera sp.]